MSVQDELQATVEELARSGKGILAADESNPTMAKRMKAIDVESTEENRRDYRALMLSTEGIGEFISGVIMFEETLGQKTEDGMLLPALAARQGVVPGIKVDKGKGPLAGAPGDEITRGLDGLEERLRGYKEQGARFAKWRCVYNVSDTLPSRLAVETNAEVLARYAAVCQELGIVPIVEPEVLMDGGHSIERCAEVTEAVQHEVFHALHRHRVALEHMVLKPNMVVSGKEHSHQAGPEEVAEQTLRILRRTTPAAVPTINFLSGGQTPEEATANLNAINQQPHRPWVLSFSYGRALQETALKAWKGDPANAARAQAALYERARLNSAARSGEYSRSMEAAA
ncbi:MAG: class I fructose-bisphosphate aldolase [Gammaproteobacteria bacterium]|nr:class I fructose-bisphosphate aldolase [Gammaproteobacteria bacterium]